MYSITDDSIALLGNALALGYFVSKVVRRRDGLACIEAYQDRLETTELRELREVLQSAGCYEDRLLHRDGYWARELQSIAEHEDWILEFVAKDDEINKIRIKDIEVPDPLSEYYGIDIAKSSADPYELRRPVSSLGPTALTRTFRTLVLEYFGRRMPIDLLASLPEHAATARTASGTKQNTAAAENHNVGERRYNTGFEETDAPFVEEGVHMVESNEFHSASAAARSLVDKYGTVAADKWKPGGKCIRTNSPQNTVQRLAKKISKQLSKKGK